MARTKADCDHEIAKKKALVIVLMREHGKSLKGGKGKGEKEPEVVPVPVPVPVEGMKKRKGIMSR